MSRVIRVIGWEKYQHYKDRNPPWIKLHREMLTSNTWVSSDDANRVLALALMLLAAATGNRIPADPKYLQRAAYLNAQPNLDHLVAIGFIEIVEEKLEPASKPEQPVPDARPEQSRAETDQRQSRAEPRARLEALKDEISKLLNSPTITMYNRVDAWIEQGADPERDVLPAIRAGLAKLNGVPPRSLKYFDGFVADAIAARQAPLPTRVAPSKPIKGAYEPPRPDAESTMLAMYADRIRKHMTPGINCTQIQVRKLIASGQVTMEQCQAAGCAP